MFNIMRNTCAIVMALASLSAADIFDVIDSGDVDLVSSILRENPALLNAPNRDNLTPLNLASYRGRAEIVAKLLELGADATIGDNENSQPIHNAAVAGHVEVLELLVSHGVDIDGQDDNGLTPLLWALARRQHDAANFLLDRGASVQTVSNSGLSAIHYAVASGQTALVERLIEAGADLNAKTANNETALYRAARGNSSDMVQLLTSHGADVDAKNDAGVTPLFFAISHLDKTTSDLLLAKGEDVGVINEAGLTMLHYSAAMGYRDQIEILIDRGADVNARDIYGRSPLYYASLWGRTETVELLIDRGATDDLEQLPNYSGEYLGQQKPGKEPVLFAPGAFLTPFSPHGRVQFSPDGREVTWSHADWTIRGTWQMKQENGVWKTPRLASFTNPGLGYSDGSGCYSPDGSRYVFQTDRPPTTDSEPIEDRDLWFTQRVGDGWSEPQRLSSLINTIHQETGPSLGPDGALYFASRDYEGSLGQHDLYRSDWVDGQFTAPENMGNSINSEHADISPAISPDGSYLVFESNRPHRWGRDLKLYASFKKPDGTWTEAIGLGRGINAGGCRFPSISPDGEYLFFMRNDQYYWFSSQVVTELRDAIVGTPLPADKNLAAVSVERSEQLFEPAMTTDIALGDLDSDGDLDAVFSNMQANDSRIFLNDGAGRFEATAQILTQQGHGVDLGDLDGDGDLDILMSCAGFYARGEEYSRPNKIYLNNGQADFTDAHQYLGDSTMSGNSAHLLDIDTDGDLDALIGYYVSEDRSNLVIVYVNDGAGNFTESGNTFRGSSNWCDLDSDGDIDNLVREPKVGFKTLINDGRGNLTEHWQKPDSTIPRGHIGFGDLDGDGDPDVVVANGGNEDARPTEVWFNDGTGRFTDSGQRLAITRWARLGFGDLNNDGHIDVFARNIDLPDYIWLNDGTGTLYDSGLRLGSPPFPGGSVSLADLDGDGDLDAFLSSFGDQSNEIWLNRRPVD